MALRKTWKIVPNSIVKTSILGIGASQIGSKFVSLSKELTINNAYIKISSIRGDKNNMTLNYVVMMGDDNVDNGFSVFAPNLEGKNFIAQGYEHLKTLPEFIDAVDC